MVKKKMEKTKAKSSKKRKTGINTKAKKKTAVARAVVKKGKGIIKINKTPLALIGPLYVKNFVSEPLLIAGKLAEEVDVRVNVKGGGFMSQAAASRAAIAKALIEYSNDKKLKEKFLQYDRGLLVDDVRRKEPKKPLGKGARRKKQKSKR